MYKKGGSPVDWFRFILLPIALRFTEAYVFSGNRSKKKRTQLAKMKDFALQTLRAPLYVNFLPTVQQFL